MLLPEVKDFGGAQAPSASSLHGNECDSDGSVPEDEPAETTPEERLTIEEGGAESA